MSMAWLPADRRSSAATGSATLACLLRDLGRSVSSTDQAGGLMLLTFGNVRFHPTGDICSDIPRGPSWANSRHQVKLDRPRFFAFVALRQVD